MIIFDLDGTLADCEHRRHFVDPNKNPEYEIVSDYECECENQKYLPQKVVHKNTGERWKPDWKAFYEACDKDKPVEPVIEIWNQQISLGMMDIHEIWSARCESVRQKTEKWLDKHLVCFNPKQLKMRPIGDNTPDDQLKEKWLDQAMAGGAMIDFVFDDRPKVIRMWRRRGIFVFDVNQSGKEF